MIPNSHFDLEAFITPSQASSSKGTKLPFPAIAAAMRGMAAETQSQAVSRLTAHGLCGRSTAYRILEQFPDHLIKDDQGRWSWHDK